MDRYREPESSAKGILFVGGSIVAVIFCLITLFLGVFKIDETERGVITRYGKFSHIAHPGLNFRLPWVDGLQRMDVRQSNPKFPNMESASSDQFPANIDVSIWVKPKTDNESLKYIYNNFGTVQNAIATVFGPLVPTDTKIVFGRYTAQKSIQERDKLNLDNQVKISLSLGENPPFIVDRVFIEDIEFSKKYMESIEARMTAEVEVQRVRQNWEREKISADILRTQADAAAYQTKIKGEAEAAAIEAQGKALSNNPRYVEMLQAQRWDGKLPTTMVPGSAVPFMSMPKQ